MRRLRRSVKRKIVFWAGTAAVSLSLLFLACFGTGRYFVKKYEPLLQQQQQVITLATRAAYVTVAEVMPGETFTEKNTEKRVLLSEEPAELFAENVIGKVAVTRVAAGMPVHEIWCTGEAYKETERECIFSDIDRAEGFREYELVDVRLRYPNGENYCVLKKKRLYKTEQKEEESRLWLSEAEQILISAARYDAMVYSGAELYFVAFPQEELQAEAESCYIPPEQSIRQLMELEDSEIAAEMSWFSLRRALEERQTAEIERKQNGW